MSGSAPHVITSLMQWAAMSAPQLRSRPRGRATIGFVPIESVEAARKRPSPSGCSAANCPTPVAPVDSTAARSRSTTAPAVASETPAASYVGALSLTMASLRTPLDEQLAEELGPALRAAADEADDGVADLDVGSVALQVEDRRQSLRRRDGIVGLQVQLGQPELVPLREQLVDPLARRMELEPVTGVRGDERPPAAVLLHAQVVPLGARERRLELVLVEHEPHVVDPRGRPLARLDDHVDRALLELAQPQLEAQRVELGPRDARLVRGEVLADPPVTGDEVERELADVASLDLPDAARDQVIVEELHRATREPARSGALRPPRAPRSGSPR